jgi:hypothetical protein
MEKISDLWGTLKGSDIFVVGTGTSLTNFDWSLLHNRITISLNDSIVSIPDATFHLYHDDIAHKFTSISRPKTTLISRTSVIANNYERSYQFRVIQALHRVGKTHLFHKATVASTGIHLAYRLGAKRIFLLGIDAYRTDKARYYDGRKKSNNKNYDVGKRFADGTITELHHKGWNDVMWELQSWFQRRGEFPSEWPGRGVYNLSPLSHITAWARVDEEVVFKGCTELKGVK